MTMSLVTFDAAACATANVAAAKAETAAHAAVSASAKAFYASATTFAQAIDSKTATAQKIAEAVKAAKAENADLDADLLYTVPASVGYHARAGRFLLLDGADIEQGRPVQTLIRTLQDLSGTKAVDAILKPQPDFKTAVKALKDAIAEAKEAAKAAAAEEPTDEEIAQQAAADRLNRLQSLVSVSKAVAEGSTTSLSDEEQTLLSSLIANVAAFTAAVGLQTPSLVNA
jgi:hypothetical protein